MGKKNEKIHLFSATCAGGIESLVEMEVKTFGGSRPIVRPGVVGWSGDLESAYRACLWSRYASRILFEIASFAADNEDKLYKNAKKIRWQNHFGQSDSFAVNCSLAKDNKGITHSQYAALRLKDAVADYFREQSGQRPQVKAVRPGVQLHLHIENGQATVSIDFSGEPLHRRGYRQKGGTAPLKESLAAAVVALSGWQKGEPLLDPMCGSGTLLVEAALMRAEIAPGLLRKYFGFIGWKGHDQDLWHHLVSEAIALEDQARGKKRPLLTGFDSDPVAVAAARKNIVAAGLEGEVIVKKKELALLQPPAKSGMLLTNLPYGERVADKDVLASLYKAYGRIARDSFSGWQIGALIADPELTDSFGLAWQQRHQLFNGPLRCRLLVGSIDKGADTTFNWQLPPPPETGAFGNRLVKNLRRVKKWADREQIECFRIYDRDLPEFNLSVDLYGKWVHVQEYSAPESVDEKLAAARLKEALAEIRAVLGVRRDRVFIKKRQRQRGRQQYTKTADKKKLREIREKDARLLVNLSDYLDTGLFLDHRPVRMRIAEEVCGKRFLNLFGYTGTATVQAAIGKASQTTTVDQSATYLRWARSNLALNGFDTHQHSLVQADCMRWLKENKDLFDLVFVDPPTFSNTSKRRQVFDVQRDHLQLISLVMEHLARDGVALFSTNFRRFKLDQRVLSLYDVLEITQKTVPYDFARRAKVHRCWELRHSASKQG